MARPSHPPRCCSTLWKFKITIQFAKLQFLMFCMGVKLEGKVWIINCISLRRGQRNQEEGGECDELRNFYLAALILAFRRHVIRPFRCGIGLYSHRAIRTLSADVRHCRCRGFRYPSDGRVWLLWSAFGGCLNAIVFKVKVKVTLRPTASQ
jgi:hypothetical protein